MFLIAKVFYLLIAIALIVALLKAFLRTRNGGFILLGLSLAWPLLWSFPESLNRAVLEFSNGITSFDSFSIGRIGLLHHYMGKILQVGLLIASVAMLSRGGTAPAPPVPESERIGAGV